MYDNQNYPWYVQKSPTFKTIYDGLFPVVSAASPLGVGSSFDINTLTGVALYKFGNMMGLQGNPTYYDGLIYNIDKWSDVKVWSGHVKDIDAKIYKNFVRMKAFLQGQTNGFEQGYSLTLLRDCIAIALDGFEYSITVDEGFMEFTININATSEVLKIFQELQAYDAHFLGKPTGIKYTFNYTATDAGTVQIDEE